MTHTVDLEKVGLSVPTMEVTIEKDAKKAIIPITDHPPIIQNVKIDGQIVAVGSYNVWNPGSPVAPEVTKKLNGSEGGPAFSLKSDDDKKRHMEATAQYIYDQFKKGVALLSLQEIPKLDSKEFTYLNTHLTTLIQNDKPPLIDEKSLKACFALTKKNPDDRKFAVNHPFGTTILFNPQIFKIEPQIGESILDGRGQIFEVSTQNNPSNKFKVAVIHGDFKLQNITKNYIDNEFKTELGKKSQKGLILGDANISVDNPLGYPIVSGDRPNSNVPPAVKVTIITKEWKTGKPLDKKEEVEVKGNTYDIVVDLLSDKGYTPENTLTAPHKELSQPPSVAAASSITTISANDNSPQPMPTQPLTRAPTSSTLHGSSKSTQQTESGSAPTFTGHTPAITPANSASNNQFTPPNSNLKQEDPSLVNEPRASSAPPHPLGHQTIIVGKGPATNNNSSRTAQAALLTNAVYIYAEPVTEGKTKFEEKYERRPFKLKTDETFKLLSSPNGIKVHAPAGLNYQLSYQNNIPIAKLDPQPSATEAEKKALTFTIINMIDNVLAKGGAVFVNTDDPMVADIANDYIYYLKEVKKINFTSEIKLKGEIYNYPDIAYKTVELSLMEGIREKPATQEVGVPIWLDELKKATEMNTEPTEPSQTSPPKPDDSNTLEDDEQNQNSYGPGI